MRSRVNLLAILLTLSCVVRLLESAKAADKHTSHKEHPLGKKVIKEVHRIAPQSAVLIRGEDKTKVVKTLTRNNGLAVSKDYFEKPGNVEFNLRSIQDRKDKEYC